MTNSLRYRADIDGLRAIAVCSVILFHAGFWVFKGGYVGVDVFFVISGFLITGISLERQRSKTFSVLDFFERRARRILPALVLVCTVATIGSVAIMDPLQLTRYFESLGFTFLFTSNFYFLFQSGYFDTASELKPLLHTWSLAVEEQYYLLFPIFFLIFMRLRATIAISLVTVLAIASLAASQLLIEMGYRSEAFYLLPTRIWQILLGVICAITAKNICIDKFPEVTSQLFSLAGLLMILVSIVAFSNNTPSPGIHAVIPTTGACLILIFSSPNTFCGRILGSKPFVLIGLLSYSAYLWHQPVFALYRLHLGEEPNMFSMLILCVVVLCLSYISWKLVETPFRSSKRFPKNRFFRVSTVSVLLLVGAAFAGSLTHGFVQQLYSAETSSRYALILNAIDYDYLEHMHDNSDCQFWTPNVDQSFTSRFEECEVRYGNALIIVGDSHGMNFYNIFAQTNRWPFIVGIVQGGCRPYGTKNTSCQYVEVEKFVSEKRESIMSLLYHQSGSDLASNFDPTNPYMHTQISDFVIDKNSVSSVLEYLHGLSSIMMKEVVWVGPFKEYMGTPMHAATQEKAQYFSTNSQTLINRFEELIQSIKTPEKIRYLPFSKLY